MLNYIYKLYKNELDVRIYCAHAMTGRLPDDLIYESNFVEGACKNLGIGVLDPVKAEKVAPGSHPLHNTVDDLVGFWKRDKEMIREAHVLVDVTGPSKSEGVAHEIGYARFFLWKPVVRVYPNLGASIARFEDDAICASIVDALVLVRQKWGTPRQRFVWRIKVLLRSLYKFIKYQIQEFK